MTESITTVRTERDRAVKACEQLSERILDLKKLVKDAYVEGYYDARNDESLGLHTDWDESHAKQLLELNHETRKT